MLSIAGLCLAIAGCGGQPILVSNDGPPILGPVVIDRVADVEVRDEPILRAGNPSSYVVFGRRYHVMKTHKGYKERGYASWYGKKFHGRKTSNGEIYDMYKLTAAHKTLPIPSYVRVTNLENGKQAILRVNDRGPFKKGRIIDLSYTAAYKLGVIKKGTAWVEVETVTPQSLEAERQAKEREKAREAEQRRIEARQNIQPTPAVETRPIANPQPAQAIKVSTPAMGQASSSAAVATTAGASVAALPQTAQPNWYLQTGAFRVRDNAQVMLERIRTAGVSGNVNIQLNQALYKVRLGPYTDQSQLEKDYEQLQRLGIQARLYTQ
ncbi:MAG: septal ring lytic transglycosylase RlpA family protein [Salinisphaeraceae bacterium]|nr:septal ring lytic transglycosylase RlpA family protein [Salinisphaeraceae bacterium]